MAIADQIIGVESSGNPLATNPYSSAVGLGQFTNQTWLNTLRQHRPDLVQQYSPQELLAMRTDPTLSRQMVQALAEDNAGYLRSRGLDTSPGSIYLAHFAGPAGAASVLGADDNAPVSSVLSPAAIAANPFLRGMTVADLKAWAGRKMGSPVRAASSQSQVTSSYNQATPSAPAQDQGAPLNLASITGDYSASASPGPAPGGGVVTPGAPGVSSQGGAPNSYVGAAQAAGLSPEMIPALFEAMRQNSDLQPVPMMRINFPTPPGIARARMLQRVMNLNPIG